MIVFNHYFIKLTSLINFSVVKSLETVKMLFQSVQRPSPELLTIQTIIYDLMVMDTDTGSLPRDHQPITMLTIEPFVL